MRTKKSSVKVLTLNKINLIIFKVCAAGFAPKEIRKTKKRRKFAKEAALEIARKNIVEDIKPIVSKLDLFSLLKHEVVLQESYDAHDNCRITLGLVA